MKRLKLDEVRELIPALDELRPILDLLALRSEPDARHAWTRSGEVESLGDRLLPGGAAADAAEELAAREHEHLRRIYTAVGEAVRQLQEGDPEASGHALLEAAALEEERDRPDRAEAYAQAALGVVRGLRNRSLSSLALRRSARAAKARGRLTESLQRYRNAFEVAEALFDARGTAEAAVGAGNVLEQQGRWSAAEEWYRKALAALEELDGNPPERWHALLNLHIARRSRGAMEASLPLLEEARAAADAAGETEEARPFLENARGQLDLLSGAWGDAEARFREALAAIGSRGASVTIRLNLAEALLAQGRTLEAAESAREAERDALVGGIVPKLPEVYRLLGRIAADHGNPDAFVLFERALEITRDERLPRLEEALTLQAYAEHEARNGDEEMALILLERAREHYEALGIDHMRHRWTEYFGPPADHDPSEHERHEDPHV